MATEHRMGPSSTRHLQLGLGWRKGTNPGTGCLHALCVKGKGRSVNVEQDGGRSLGERKPGFSTWKCVLSHCVLPSAPAERDFNQLL